VSKGQAPRQSPVGRSIHVTRKQFNFGWNRDHPPAVTVQSGSELTVHTADSAGGQITRDSTPASVAAIDFARVNPVSGPIYVADARVGDVLEVEILEMSAPRFGWTVQIPGFGLLADQFPEPWLHLWDIGPTRAPFRDGISIPVEPFCGVIGLSPAEQGTLSVVPPRRVGGNLDIKQLGPGTRLYLPVEVEGALLGIGDTHAAQGDGEVCGSAIETQLDVTIKVRVRRDMSIETPELDVTRPLERQSSAERGYHITSGVAPDLMVATRQSVERMIVHLGKHYNLDPQEAYALCSVAVDLRISEVVDAPNWVVSAFLPKDLFTVWPPGATSRD
jgi:acetamidase/formamidase